MRSLTGDKVFFEVFLGWLVGHVLGIAAHEAGHAFAAIATGMPVKKVVVGWGETVFAGEYRGIRIELNRIPSGGVTHIAEGIHLRKGAMLFMLLAGSLGNLLLLLGAVACWYHGLLPSSADYATLGFVCAQIFLIALALLPDAVSIDKSGWSTDGEKIAFILNQKNGSLTPVAACHLQSLEPYANGKGHSTGLSPASRRLIDIHHALHHSHAELPSEIAQAAIAELGKGEMSREEELMVLDTLVTDAVVYGNCSQRAGMNEWSVRAMELGSHINTIRFSRAAVLIELGRFADGKALIEAWQTENPYDAILNSIFLAKAEAGLGNHSRASELLAQVSPRIKDELPATLQAATQSLWRRVKEGLPAKS